MYRALTENIAGLIVGQCTTKMVGGCHAGEPTPLSSQNTEISRIRLLTWNPIVARNWAERQRHQKSPKPSVAMETEKSLLWRIGKASGTRQGDTHGLHILSTDSTFDDFSAKNPKWRQAMMQGDHRQRSLNVAYSEKRTLLWLGLRATVQRWVAYNA